jgi:hypothetical protein
MIVFPGVRAHPILLAGAKIREIQIGKGMENWDLVHHRLRGPTKNATDRKAHIPMTTKNDFPSLAPKGVWVQHSKGKYRKPREKDWR